MATPKGKTPPEDMAWAVDNGRFSAPRSYTDEGFIRWLKRHDPARCLFAVAPDVLGDHQATVALSRPVMPEIRRAGYRVAFVAQDGWDERTVPWTQFDCLFIGGTTQFKLSAGRAIAAAHRHVKWVHMGRVNSFKRLRVAAAMGCQSADGTFLKFAPKTNVPRMLKWLENLERQPLLETVP